MNLICDWNTIRCYICVCSNVEWLHKIVIASIHQLNYQSMCIIPVWQAEFRIICLPCRRDQNRERERVFRVVCERCESCIWKWYSKHLFRIVVDPLLFLLKRIKPFAFQFTRWVRVCAWATRTFSVHVPVVYPYQIQMPWHFDEFALLNILYHFSHAYKNKNWYLISHMHTLDFGCCFI